MKYVIGFTLLIVSCTLMSIIAYVEEIKDVIPQDIKVTVNANSNVTTCTSKRGAVNCRSLTATQAPVTKE